MPEDGDDLVVGEADVLVVAEAEDVLVGEFMNRTRRFNSLFSFLLLEECVHGLELPEDVVGVDLDVDVAGRLEDSQVADVPFRLLDLSVFTVKSAIVLVMLRVWPYASRTPNENFSFEIFGVASANDDICRGPDAAAKLWNPGCPG